MEEIGPEATKRPRLDSFAGAQPMHRMHPQHTESPLPLHSYQAHVLPPPSAHNQPLPPSPYDSSHDHRNLPDPPQQHVYPHPHSGYTTPVQISRPFQTEPPYSRHGSLSAPTRSPDEVLPHPALRPLNTASANEGHHYSQNSEASGHPAAYGPHDGYANGSAHGLPMSASHDLSQRHPPLGQYAGYSESPVGAGAPPYSAGPYGPPQDWMNRQQQGPRKNTRALQACDTCRNRKAKCDEGKPVCGYCRDNSVQCRYKEVAPPKADRAQKEIMDSLKALNEKVERLQARLERPTSGHSGPSFPSSRDFSSPIAQRLLVEDDIKKTSVRSDSDELERKLILHGPDTAILGPETSDRHAELESAGLDVPGGEISYGSIVVDHMVGAHRLLGWLTIKALLKQFRPLSQDYVMEMEEKKGLLRLYGRGQGRDTYDGAVPGPASPVTSTPSIRSDDTSRSPASVATPPDVWGTSLGPPDPRLSIHDHPGGLNPDGTLKLDWGTMDRLRDNYLKSLHILHPFLNKTRLARMFARVYVYASSDSGQMRSPYLPHNASVWSDTALNKATKRKHSNTAFTDSPYDMSTSNSSRGTKEQPLERRISTAIVLLVMALGKICEHKAPLPGPVTDNPRESLPRDIQLRHESHNSESPPMAANFASAVKPSPSNSSGSPMSEHRTAPSSRRSSMDPQNHTLGYKPERNVDVIPGLAYFARATEILGNMNGGQDLMHVQAYLLASLYTSQLACVLESWSWIQNACRACRFLTRDPSLSKESDLTRADMIRFAYWTCLQFEFDILAELDLQKSGIESNDAGDVAYPNGVSDDSTDLGDLNRPEAMVLAYYSFQIQLRTTLNKIQVILYPPGEKNQNSSHMSLLARDQCLEMLEDWFSLLPSQLRWSDQDLPDTDINVARLRAKYYGARYIIHRPFLETALHSKELRDDIDRYMATVPRAYGGPSYGTRKNTMPPPSSKERLGKEDQVKEILRSAQLCIDNAMLSTEAFDGVRTKSGRLIVTNIFGTAHAQFGNMMVLAATHCSHLGRLVDKKKLLRLLERTIHFLSELGPISTTLDLDSQILRHVRVRIAKNDEQASSSFSSVLS